MRLVTCPFLQNSQTVASSLRGIVARLLGSSVGGRPCTRLSWACVSYFTFLASPLVAQIQTATWDRSAKEQRTFGLDPMALGPDRDAIGARHFCDGIHSFTGCVRTRTALSLTGQF